MQGLCSQFNRKAPLGSKPYGPGPKRYKQSCLTLLMESLAEDEEEGPHLDPRVCGVDQSREGHAWDARYC